MITIDVLGFITHNGLSYITIKPSSTGKVWLDRNMGAGAACTPSGSSECWGDYYQWGRSADGHESQDSTMSNQRIAFNTLSDKFINATDDWATGDDGGGARQSMWFDGSGVNICPVGYNVPTQEELGAEFALRDDAFLQSFPLSGIRNYDWQMGNVGNSGSWGYVWSREQDDGNDAKSIVFNYSKSAMEYLFHRNKGMGVRCVR
jgi:hypothetical protein